MCNKYIVFGAPQIEDEEISEVVNSLKSGWLGTGPKVRKFEEIFREYKGSKYSAALNSCTAALHLSLLVIGIETGDEVIVPSMTFAATANSVIHAGGKPVFADCKKDTMNINPVEIEKKITNRTKAIVAVHFAGRPCEMDSIMEIAKKYNLKVIEDCAHAIESEYKGRKTGTIGDIGCFSFYVTKNVVTGEGGMLITNNENYIKKIKIMSLHGLTSDAWNRFSDDGYKHYSVVAPGYKYNMMDIQASIGIHQLNKVEKFSQRRKEIWNYYNEAFKNLPFLIPASENEKNRHAYHLYTLLIDKLECGISRDELIVKLHSKKIGTGVHYIALHLHKYYSEKYSYKLNDFPNSTWISERTISIPLSPKISDNEVDYIVDNIKKIVR